MKILDNINSPCDLKKIELKMLPQLAKEIREFLIQSVSKTGGHLASNLGIVELTIALHYCFCSPKDKIIWDVGHQSYVHKILTGRKDEFDTLRMMGGISGFPKPCENENDAFATGHSSTSISAALGIAASRDMAGKRNKVIAVIGDGSISGGLAYEAMNNAGRTDTDIIVILNDNEMSISPNVGAMSKYFNDLRTGSNYIQAKEGVHSILERIPTLGKPVDKTINRIKDSVKQLILPGMLFEELGFTYVGPIDGHNITAMVSAMNRLKRIKGPVLLHVYTVKGKGYEPAEKFPQKFHGVGAFDIKTGELLNKSDKPSYTSVFGKGILNLARKNTKIVAITAAMVEGTGLEAFEKMFPKRFYDVAIAEAHAVTFAAGLAISGYVPVFAVYSTFLQRAYDEIVNDVCLQNLHVVFAIDRAGIVGADGETHQGIFDVSFLNHIPNMTFMAPKNGLELTKMLEFAINFNGPIAFRYPRDTASEILPDNNPDIIFGKSEIIETGKKIALISTGSMFDTVYDVFLRLKAEGESPMLINARFLKPIDKEMLEEAADFCEYIYTFEDNVKTGGFGSVVAEYLSSVDSKAKVRIFALPDTFIKQGSRSEMLKKLGLDADNIFERIKKETGITK